MHRLQPSDSASPPFSHALPEIARLPPRRLYGLRALQISPRPPVLMPLIEGETTLASSAARDAGRRRRLGHLSRFRGVLKDDIILCGAHFAMSAT